MCSSREANADLHVSGNKGADRQTREAVCLEWLSISWNGLPQMFQLGSLTREVT